MSIEYPIVAITGASDYSTTTITQALQHIFYRERIKAVYISGSGFHRFDRKQMREEVAKARQEGRSMSHMGPSGNHFDKLESMFFQYAATGTGWYRYYLHSQAFAERVGQESGTFTPWQAMDPDSDLLLYRGLHGAVVHGDIDLSIYPDLLIGAIPSLNLEWMRRIHREVKRGYSEQEVREVIIGRLRDYAEYMAPQFERTDINFQIVPMVDTSDPFHFDELPTPDECYLVIHFQTVAKRMNMMNLLQRIPKAHMSRRDTMVVPGAQMNTAIEIILVPLIHDLIVESRRVRGITKVSEDRGAGILGMQGQFA